MPLDSKLIVLDPRAGRYVARTAVEIASIATITAVGVGLLFYLTKDSTTFTSALVFYGTACTALFVAGAALLKRLANLLTSRS